jgi:integrase
MKIRIGKRTLDKLPATDRERGVRYTDEDVRGFSVMKYPSGQVAYYVVYVVNGKRGSFRIGTYPPMAPDKAREEAKNVLARAQTGIDPAAAKRAAREMATFAEWADDYMEEVKRRKKNSSKDRLFLDLAKKRWGSRPLDSLTVEDVRRMFESITAKGTPIHANRWLASVRACLQAAWREDKIPGNPAMKVRANPENPPRDRVLSDDEFRRLLVQVNALQDMHVKAAFVLLIETGARVSEVLRSQWTDFDLDAGVWKMPKTKSGRPQMIPLAPSTIAVLANLDRDGLYVIPGKNPGKPRSELRDAWAKLQVKSEIPDVHMHDLRRTFGLHVARAAGIHVASRLLRHSTISITERHYAPLGLDDMRKALDAREADVIPLRRKTEEGK